MNSFAELRIAYNLLREWPQISSGRKWPRKLGRSGRTSPMRTCGPSGSGRGRTMNYHLGPFESRRPSHGFPTSRRSPGPALALATSGRLSRSRERSRRERSGSTRWTSRNSGPRTEPESPCTSRGKHPGPWHPPPARRPRRITHPGARGLPRGRVFIFFGSGVFPSAPDHTRAGGPPQASASPRRRFARSLFCSSAATMTHGATRSRASQSIGPSGTVENMACIDGR